MWLIKVVHLLDTGMHSCKGTKNPIKIHNPVRVNLSGLSNSTLSLLKCAIGSMLYDPISMPNLWSPVVGLLYVDFQLLKLKPIMNLICGCLA